jgi:hypothetical protein
VLHLAARIYRHTVILKWHCLDSHAVADAVANASTQSSLAWVCVHPSQDMTVTKGYALGDLLTEIMHRVLAIKMPPQCLVRNYHYTV